MTQTFREATIEEICNIEYGTRVVRKKDAGTIYPVYGGGGKTFFLDSFNRENRVVIARFAMSEKCTRRVIGKFALNDSGLTLSPKDESILRQDYLDYFILSLNNQIYESARGTAQKNLDVPAFRQMKVVYPASIKKQREIVGKLDSAFAEIDLLEKNLGLRISATENLQASLLASFYDLDEDEVTEDYTFHSLGSVSLVKGGKRLPKGTKWSPIPTKYPYIRVTDMKLGRIIEDNLVFVPDEIRPLIKNYTVDAGDIIISIAGTVGEIAVVPETLDKASLTENAAKIILQKEKLDSDYCSYFLRSPVCRREIDSLTRTTTQPKLALFRIESLRIPIPPIKRQREIVYILHSSFSEIELLRSRFQSEKNNIALLRQSFLINAFTQEEAVS
jgi:type I restriction enzyme S subunit